MSQDQVKGDTQIPLHNVKEQVEVGAHVGGTADSHQGDSSQGKDSRDSDCKSSFPIESKLQKRKCSDVCEFIKKLARTNEDKDLVDSTDSAYAKIIKAALQKEKKCNVPKLNPQEVEALKAEGFTVYHPGYRYTVKIRTPSQENSKIAELDALIQSFGSSISKAGGGWETWNSTPVSDFTISWDEED